MATSRNNRNANAYVDGLSEEEKRWAQCLNVTDENSDSANSGVPEHFQGVLTVTKAEPVSVPVDGTENHWTPVTVKTKEGVEYQVNAAKLVRIPGNWGTNKITARAANLTGAVFTISDYIFIAPDDTHDYTRKKFVGTAKVKA